MKLPYSILEAEEAARLVLDGQTVAFSGFTPAGAPKKIPTAIADRATAEHEQGRPFKIGVVTGASTGRSLDGALARADAISFRTPYQSDPDLRRGINQGRIHFFDMHLSMLPQNVRYGFLGKIDWAVVEACDVTPSGEIVLTSSVGAAPTFCHKAEKILVELNSFHPPELLGLHDIYEPESPPQRQPIPICFPSQRVGLPVIKVDPAKIIGVVRTNCADETGSFKEPSETTQRIGENVAEFLVGELRRGTIPPQFLPVQSGVGDTANAVLGAMGAHPDIPVFDMYTEVLQDAVIRLMREERIRFASSCSLTVAPETLQGIYQELDWFRSRMLLRPQELTNHPEVVRRLGIISVNTAIEVDIGGNVNSTHILGRSMMNGIGGSGDFARNAYLSIFTCPSITKGGKISTIVPAVTHLDHSEHSVQIIVTEQGVADLRGKSPHERAETIIKKCAHPEFRDSLRDYMNLARESHTPQTIGAEFRMHLKFMETGDMHNVDWSM